MTTIRAATEDDSADIIALNARFVSVTSPMDDSRFRYLFDCCCLCSVAEVEGRVAAFVMAMCQGAAYDNENFQWFSDRLNRFIYVDRVVVSEAGQGRGLANALYSEVARNAGQKELCVMAAEIDLMPANASSLRFHEKQGFQQLGTRTLQSGKTVSMQIKGL